MKAVKKLIALFAAAALASTAVISAAGATIYKYGGWSFVISAKNEYEVYSCDKTDESLTIPVSVDQYKVTSIGDYALMGLKSVKNVKMKAPLSRIGDYAFMNCDALQTATLPETVTEIGCSAFYGASSLRSVNLEDTGITAVSDSLFLSSGISEIVLPESCTAVAGYAFSQCVNLKKAVIPDSVTEISDTAFDSGTAVVIYCAKDSYARKYAEAHKIQYILTDAESYILGDANGDERLNVLDATRIQRFLANLIQDPDGKLRIRGDADRGGYLDVFDVTLIQRYLAFYQDEDGKDIGKTFAY